jgi:hypothetical protein
MRVLSVELRVADTPPGLHQALPYRLQHVSCEARCQAQAQAVKLEGYKNQA